MPKTIAEKIKDLQFGMIERYYNEYKKLYAGEISYEQYKRSRVDNVSLWYAKGMVKLGVAKSSFTKEWIKKFADDTLASERELVALKNGITEEEEAKLCKVAMDKATEFFKNFHNDYCPRLADKNILHENYERNELRMQRQLDEAIKKDPNLFKQLDVDNRRIL